jgi:hypothetical protein
MPAAEFEAAIPANEWLQTHSLDGGHWYRSYFFHKTQKLEYTEQVLTAFVNIAYLIIRDSHKGILIQFYT